MFALTGTGPLSAATVGAVGHDRKKPSPELWAAFAAFLTIPVEDLTAMGGLGLPAELPQFAPEVADLAELICDVRRLTVDQMRHVRDEARAMAAQSTADANQVRSWAV
ncbi:hypothetical protein O7635_09140 [Asanoa sp. WMMD1127]|uniref:hypothetical protein n=1 Tax=Asanoa sp. WMMD1127 TaxID=3016107 RepID=UPI002415ECFD|nr:hypothetical protein [Asanoa sp. WMMD1127]MDG4822018.1 hypothetical protein [Asanoa sp. WMMD1127]